MRSRLLRFLYESDDVDVTLISVCTRVTPLEKQTIPRLELDALRIGINLATTISEESNIESEEGCILNILHHLQVLAYTTKQTIQRLRCAQNS